MAYKSSDRFRVIGAAGEWQVESTRIELEQETVWVVNEDGVRMLVLPSMMDQVPTLPPEPAYGEGVFANDDRLWGRSRFGWNYIDSDTTCVQWSDIAADADRAVPEKAHRKQVIDEVVAWMRMRQWYFDEECFTVDSIEQHFGGDDE